jgi:hypothetical protein
MVRQDKSYFKTKSERGRQSKEYTNLSSWLSQSKITAPNFEETKRGDFYASLHGNRQPSITGSLKTKRFLKNSKHLTITISPASLEEKTKYT